VKKSYVDGFIGSGINGGLGLALLLFDKAIGADHGIAMLCAPFLITSGWVGVVGITGLFPVIFVSGLSAGFIGTKAMKKYNNYIPIIGLKPKVLGFLLSSILGILLAFIFEGG
jgi:hypothetical protein